MKKLTAACFAGAVACAIMLSSAGCADVSGKTFSGADVTIQAGPVSEAKDISDLLFGLFLEDINYASYALDANMVANGNFEAIGAVSGDFTTTGWSSIDGAEFKTETESGVLASNAVYRNEDLETDVNPHYLAVTATKQGAGVSNRGYTQVPILVEKGASYRFSAFIKSPQRPAVVTVSVGNQMSKAFTETISVPQGDEWIRYERIFTSSRDFEEQTHLDITFDNVGTYYLDGVRFETMEQTVGIKNYIYDAIADLSPKFMRFPGGCIIEGDNANVDEKGRCREVYDWKNSIGAAVTGTNAGDDDVPAFTYKVDTDGTVKEVTTYGEWLTRTNNFDLWGYNMDYGLGFYEYFLLCEKIGASPVPIVNCGFSDQGGAADISKRGTPMVGRHSKYAEDYVQDALDLIEFANGDVTTKWGKIRSDMGHPEPFNMKYIGIGNEQFTRTYYNYYDQFLDAFRAAQKEHPEIYGGVQPIVGSGLVFTDCEGSPDPGNRAYLAPNAMQDYLAAGKIEKVSEYGVVDHHYYMDYLDFFHFATPENCIYDKDVYDGTYKVFVGEYSANGATHTFHSLGATEYLTNSWFTALSEAAYMTAIERNGDVVDLAAYAPMFGVCDPDTKKQNDKANQWAVDMMYFTNKQLLLSPNYYTQQIFMKNCGTHVLNSTMTAREGFSTYSVDGVELDRMYQSVTYDEKTGDIIVKLVNGGDTEVKVNVELEGASVKGNGAGTVLTGKYGARSINTLHDDGYEVQPKSFTIGAKANFGYEAPAFSVTVIRLHTK